MNSKVVCFFLILSVVVALTAATFEDDVEQFLYEDMMEKRARGRGKGGKKMSYQRCPDNPRCYCLYNRVTGEYGKSSMCGQADAANVGI